MATFLKGRRKITKEDDTLPPPPPELNGSGPAVSSEAPTDRTQPNDTPTNNTTEFEYMRSMFTNLHTTMPLVPVPKRPGRIGAQPQGSDACHLIIAANNANLKFSKCFNSKDSAGCASVYMKGALMEARPNGMALGRKMIETFWTSVHAGNPGPIRYSNVRMRVVDKDTVTFSSNWTFNTMKGIIMLETWRRQCDGTFELDEDRFKIEEVFPAPRVATPEETELGLLPLHEINEVMQALAWRIDQFNAGNVDGFISSYTSDALQTVDPLANSFGHEEIRKVAGFYIENRKSFGTGLLSYNNFNVKVMDARTVHVSGDWDLGGYLKGYMNIQKYVKQPNGKWLLELDDWTVEPTDFLY